MIALNYTKLSEIFTGHDCKHLGTYLYLLQDLLKVAVYKLHMFNTHLSYLQCRYSFNGPSLIQENVRPDIIIIVHHVPPPTPPSLVDEY